MTIEICEAHCHNGYLFRAAASRGRTVNSQLGCIHFPGRDPRFSAHRLAIMALDGSGGPRKISVLGSDDPHRAFSLDMAGEALRTVARDPAVPASSTIEARPPVCRIKPVGHTLPLLDEIRAQKGNVILAGFPLRLAIDQETGILASFADTSAGVSPSNSRRARKIAETLRAIRSSTSATCFAV